MFNAGLRPAPDALRLAGRLPRGSERETVLSMSRAAHSELEEFATSDHTTWSGSSVWQTSMTMVVWQLRPLGFGRRWATGPGFWRAWARAGGECRLNVLLTVARFDRDLDGVLTDEEYGAYQKSAENLVNMNANTFQNIAILAVLVIGSSHLAVIGRPTPWAASDETVAAFGQDSTQQLLSVAYSLLVLQECVNLILIGSCLLNRLLLTNFLATLESKLAYLAEYNPMATTTWIAVSHLQIPLSAYGTYAVHPSAYHPSWAAIFSRRLSSPKPATHIAVPRLVHSEHHQPRPRLSAGFANAGSFWRSLCTTDGSDFRTCYLPTIPRRYEKAALRSV